MNPYLSVVIPIYNEEANIPQLWERLAKVLDRNFTGERNWELIFTDDGSKDRSLMMLLELAKSEPRIKVVEFNRNYGQHSAIFAALAEVEGRVVVTLDADLQNPPEEIPKLVAKVEEGYDVVGGWRQGREDHPHAAARLHSLSSTLLQAALAATCGGAAVSPRRLRSADGGHGDRPLGRPPGPSDPYGCRRPPWRSPPWTAANTPGATELLRHAECQGCNTRRACCTAAVCEAGGDEEAHEHKRECAGREAREPDGRGGADRCGSGRT